jgi:hypothetical protein
LLSVTITATLLLCHKQKQQQRTCCVTNANTCGPFPVCKQNMKKKNNIFYQFTNYMMTQLKHRSSLLNCSPLASWMKKVTIKKKSDFLFIFW